MWVEGIPRRSKTLGVSPYRPQESNLLYYY